MWTEPYALRLCVLHEFLDANRLELAERCRAKVATRSSPPPSGTELEHGIPVLIEQLVETLRGMRLAGQIVRTPAPQNIERSAALHGGQLLRRGFTVDQVVHDYGDLCQAVTELAAERKEPITVEEFHEFNRCLDSAIANAVSEFGRQRDDVKSVAATATLNERLGSLAHELRNLLNTSTLAFTAIRSGHGAITGATGSVLERSLQDLRGLLDRELAGARLVSGLHAQVVLTPIDEIIEQARIAAQLEAAARRIAFSVSIEPELAVNVDQQMLASALANLLQNAFKFTLPSGHVTLTAHVVDNRVRIEVADGCGGLSPGMTADLFKPFVQRNADRSGVGLGLAISRRAVEANGGTISVRDRPGTGCIFTIELPRS